MRLPRFAVALRENFRARRRRRQLRLVSEWTKSTGPLRQFVYLDEVALRSLMASRYGAETVSFTETQSTSREAGLTGSVEGGIPGGAKVSGEARFQTTSARSREVQRQTTTQSLFADFLARIKREKALTWDATTSGNTSPATLQRGDLIEVRIVLEADPLYRLGATVTELEGWASLAASFGATLSTTELEAISKLLGRLMIGQVPIRARILGALAREVASKLTLSSTRTSEDPSVDVYLVGTTEVDQFWTDTRRVLFGSQEFTALVRVTDDSPTPRWSPIKVMALLSNILPNLPDELAVALRQLEPAAPAAEVVTASPIHLALKEYAVACGLSSDLADAVADTAQPAPSTVPSATNLNAAFDNVDKALADAQVKLPEADERRRLRDQARLNAGITVHGAPRVRTEAALRPSKEVSAVFVEGEIIAIYW